MLVCLIRTFGSRKELLVILLVLLLSWGRLPASSRPLMQHLLARWRLPTPCL